MDPHSSLPKHAWIALPTSLFYLIPSLVIVGGSFVVAALFGPNSGSLWIVVAGVVLLIVRMVLRGRIRAAMRNGGLQNVTCSAGHEASQPGRGPSERDRSSDG